MINSSNKNIRIPLQNGTELTKNITILSLLSSSGGSSLTYLAKDEYQRTIVIKETYPLYSASTIIRDGNKLFFSEDALSGEIAEIHSKFDDECKKSNQVYSSGDSNSVFSFRTEDITNEVLKNPEFEGTQAKYLAIATVNGKTLSEILEDNPHLTLQEAFLYARKILITLRDLHSKCLLHLDLKSDNIFFPKQLSKPVDTFAIFLDCGSVKSLADIKNEISFSFTERFSARELQNLAFYSVEPYNTKAAEKYRSMIGYSTDLYSVGALLFMMIMGRAYDTFVWDKINGSDSIVTRKKLLSQELAKIMLPAFPYLYDYVLKILTKSLFFYPDKKRIDAQRYSSCDEFLLDIETILEIFDDKGIHPEIFARRCFAQSEKYSKQFADINIDLLAPVQIFDGELT